MFSIYEGAFDLFRILGTNGDVYFHNSTFKMLSLFDNILRLEKLCGNLILNYMKFEENEVYSHILSVKEARNITINNTICIYTNNKNAVLYQNAGGVFRLYNTLNKIINNLEISFSFSVKTCFGIKIIDDSTRNISYPSSKPLVKNIFSLYIIINIDRQRLKIAYLIIIFYTILQVMKGPVLYFSIVRIFLS